VETPAGWYPEPDGSGGQRYYDGRAWTEHRAPPPGPWPPPHWGPSGSTPWGAPSWKGAELGRPAEGPGSLAEPGRRLGARLLDALVMIPVLALLVALAVALVAPHAGPLFPVNPSDNPDARLPTPGIVWIYLAVLGAVAVTGVLAALYDAVATARFGRTLGKRWLRIRPLGTDGGPLGWGRAFGRIGIYWLSTLFGWVGFIDPLWCLWDANRQCLHDKVASTIVVND
jgi:uncharacterized RDD family membrane protein YckC